MPPGTYSAEHKQNFPPICVTLLNLLWKPSLFILSSKLRQFNNFTVPLGLNSARSGFYPSPLPPRGAPKMWSGLHSKELLAESQQRVCGGCWELLCCLWPRLVSGRLVLVPTFLTAGCFMSFLSQPLTFRPTASLTAEI